MAWRPSDDDTIQHPAGNALWEAIQGLFANQVGISSVPRRDWQKLQQSYIIKRRFDGVHDTTALWSRLPPELRKLPLGPTEIELADFIVNYAHDRVLNIEGPRGSGKTSLLRYVEEAVRQSGYARWPIFLMVDCLSDRDDKELQESDIVRLIGEEMLRTSAAVPESFGLPLRACAADILNIESQHVLRTKFVLLRESLGLEMFHRLVLVFDNLDQHSTNTIARCIEVSKQLHVSTSLACLMTLRPGCLREMFARGGARAYFRFKMDVSAPTTQAWMESLGSRVAAEADVVFRQTRTYKEAMGVQLTPEKLREVFLRLGDLLVASKREEDSAMGILDSVAADDIRHLILLIRNLLSHRDLPVAWLLGMSDSSPEFHPIPAILEGEKFLYAGKSFVPNLLCSDASDGTHDFLIAHRILTLLNGGVHPVSTRALDRQVQVLGHTRTSFVECLKVLHDALLIRSTNAESLAAHGALPEAFFITNAGEYYLHRFVRFVDYLVTVVTHIPLSHESVRLASRSRKRRFGYLDRLVSLQEYVLKVQALEEAQINRLQLRAESEDLGALADALENGGLLTRSLVDGLDSARERGEYSSNRNVHLESKQLENQITRLREWQGVQQQRLHLIAEKSRDRRVPDIPATTLSDRDTQVVVKQKAAMSSTIQTMVEVRTSRNVPYALIAILGETENTTFSTAALAIRKEGSPNVLIAELPNSENNSGKRIHNIKAQAITTGFKGFGRIGLLTTSDNGGDTLHLRLQLLKSDKAGIERRDIGREVLFSQITETVQDINRAVQRATSEPSTFNDTLREQGTRLARLLMNERDENIFGSYTHLIDTLVIFISKAAMSIPWEWLRPAPVPDDPQPASLGEAFKVVRWPADNMGDVISGMAELSLIEPENALAPLATVGLKIDETRAWRAKSPRRVNELFDMGTNCATLHIVGHIPSDEQVLQVLGNGPHISEHSIRANLIRGARHVILSGCEAASTKHATNLAIELSTTSGCAVWAPLVRIRESDVDSLDDEIAAFITKNPTMTMADFFELVRRNGHVLAQLYTRFGICKGGSNANPC